MVNRPTVVRKVRSPRPAVESFEDRRLFAASLSVASGLMVFNAVQNSSASPTETVNLTNTGDAPLSLAVSLGNDPTQSAGVSHFAIVNGGSIPASLDPGASFALQLNYTATAAGRDGALVDITTNDPVNPTQTISLHGIGTTGRGGTNQPSLARILRAYDIPTIVGEGPNDSNEANASMYPTPPDASSQEVTMQRLVKAGAGPVTVQVLASFTADAAEPYTLGTYTPGDPNDRNELFFTPTAEAQSVYVHPQGATQFDPGSGEFGFYFVSNIKDNGVNRIGYQEDSLNTWDTTVNRKFRFFPLENPDGSTVPNAYVMTSTEWNAPIGYDFTNIVAVVRNVTVAPRSVDAVFGLTNADGLPTTTRIAFSHAIASDPNKPTATNTYHDVATIKVNDTGTAPLVLSSYAITGPWSLVNAPAFPVTVSPGSVLSLQIKFTATQQANVPYNETNSDQYPSAGGVWNGAIVFNSNDPARPTRTLSLAGWRQFRPENDNEPSVQTVANLVMGYQTVLNTVVAPTFNNASASPTYYGEEVASYFWNAADTGRPVSIQMIGSYHSQDSTYPVYWYNQGSNTNTPVLNASFYQGQTVLPLANGSTTALAAGSFSPGGSFGLKFDNVYTDDTRNTQNGSNGHQVRFWPLRDSTGEIVPNTYLVAMDYNVAGSINYDYNDGIFLVGNVRPTAVPPTPADLYATASATTSTLQWAPVNYGTLAGYLVYRSTSSQGTYTLLTPTPITTAAYTDTSAPAGSTVYYKVTAIDTTGNAQSIGATTSTTTAAVATTGAGNPIPKTYSTTTLAGTPVVFSVVADATDATGTINPSKINVTTAPSHGTTTIDAVDGQITYTPAAGYTGTDAFKYTLTDSTGAVSSAATATIDVGAVVVGTPIANSSSVSTANATPVTIDAFGLASDGTASLNRSSVVILTGPTQGTAAVNTSSGGIVYTPTGTYAGTDTLTYQISDDLGAKSNVGTITITVLPVNVLPGVGSPVADNLSAVVSPQGTAVVTAAGTDATATIDLSKVKITTAPGHGTAVVDGSGNLTYTPAAGYVGPDTLQYTVGDSLLATSAPATVNLSTPVYLGVPLTAGFAAARSITFVDSSGNKDAVSLNTGLAAIAFDGSGSIKYLNKTGLILTGSGLSVASIGLSGTTVASNLTLAGRSVAVGSVTASSAFGRINGPTTVFGPITTLGLTSLTAQSVAGAMTVAGSISALTANSVASGWAGFVTGAIGSMTVKANGFTGSLTAAAAGTIKIVGAVAGSTLRFTNGPVARGYTLNRLIVTGQIDYSTIYSGGNINSISSAGMTGSSIKAAAAGTGLPADSSVFTAVATINNVSVAGRSAAFGNSVIAAATIGNLSLGKLVTTNAGTPFGVAASLINSLTATPDTGRPFKATKAQLATETAFTAFVAAKPITLYDFTVRLPG